MQNREERLRVLMKNNEQTNLETRNCIKSALLRLLEHEKYENISMTDIIRKSGVSRMGVYNNYKSKDEIMIDLYQKPLDTFFFSLDISIDSNLEWLLQTAYQHKKAIRTLIDAGLSYIILDMMNARFQNASRSFYITIWNGLLYNSVIEWVRNDTDESAESAIERMKNALQLCKKAIETGTTVPMRDAGAEQ